MTSDDDETPKIVLDQTYQEVQTENHAKHQEQVLQEAERIKNHARFTQKEGELILARVFAGKYSPPQFEVFMIRLSIVLFLMNAVWLLGPVRMHGWENVTFFAYFIVMNIRPYVVFAIFSAICFLVTLRLRYRSIFRELIHGMTLANPNPQKLAEIENRVAWLKRKNQACALPICMLLVVFGFSIVGWEYAITSIAGLKGFVGFAMT